MVKILGSWLLIISMFTFISCENDVKDVSDDSSSSTFDIDVIDKLSFGSLSSNGNWPDLKDKASIVLTTCLVDRVYKETIVGEDFEITSNNGTSHTSTDIHGCFSWREEFNFDYTTDETFFKLEGTIKGVSRFKGVKHFRVAINPWDGTLVDLGKGGTVPKLRSSHIDYKQKSYEKQFEVSQYNINVDRVYFDQNYAKVSLNITVVPQIIRRQIDGKKAPVENFTGGTFETEYVLVQKLKGSSQRLVLASQEQIRSINAEGKLVNEIVFEIDSEILPGSTVELMMKTVPVDAHLNIGIDEGYMEVTSLVEPSSGKMENLPMKFTQMVKLADELSAIQKTTHNYQHGFIINKIKGNDLVNHGTGNLVFHSTERTKRSEIHIDMVDSIFRKGINGYFNVELKNLESGKIVFNDEISTDKRNESGTLIIAPDIDYDETTPYGYQEYLVTINGVSDPFDTIKRSRKVFINPRVKGPAFVLDSTIHDKPVIKNDEQPRIYLRSFDYKFISNDDDSSYTLNKNLDLLTNRVMRVQFRPKLMVPNNPNGEDLPEIKTGEFNVSLMIYTANDPLIQAYNNKVDLNDFYLITGEMKKNVESVAGLITVDFKLPHTFDEKLYLAFKNLAVLYIESTNQKSGWRPGSLLGTITILDKSNTVQSIYDSSTKSDDILTLQQSNEILLKSNAKTMDFDYKLVPDSDISSRYLQFKEDLLSRENSEKVPVIDHKKYKRVLKDARYEVFDSEEEFMAQELVSINEAEVKAMVSKLAVTKNTFKNICALLYDPNVETIIYGGDSPQGGFNFIPTKNTHKGLEYKRCLADPVAHIDLKPLKFIEEITKQPRELRDFTGDQTIKESARNLNRSEAYFATKGEMFQEMKGDRYSNYYGYSVKNGFEGFFKVLGSPISFFTGVGVDVGKRVDHYTMAQNSKLFSNQRRIINQDGVKFHLSEIEATFEAKIKKCVLIAPKYVEDYLPKRYKTAIAEIREFLDDFEMKEKKVVVSSPVRQLVCSKFSELEVVNEMWYFISLNTSDSVADMTLAKNSIGNTLRGKKAYNEFREIDTENDKKILIHPETNEEVVNRYKNFIKKKGKDINYKNRTGIGYPGLIEPF